MDGCPPADFWPHSFFQARINTSLIEQIDALLPQTQCGQCGYPACKPYAVAIASGEADIDRCPPGGAEGVRALAKWLRVAAKPLDKSRGLEKPPAAALIDEDLCIGCARCLPACPVDAILGAARQMHTVLSDECTGCERCLPVCPVDCIRMEFLAASWMPRERARADGARQRFEARQARLEREKRERREAAQRLKTALARAAPG